MLERLWTDHRICLTYLGIMTIVNLVYWLAR